MDQLYKVQARFLFCTPIRIKIPRGYPDSLFDEFFRVLQRVDQKFNSHRKGSVTDRINQQAGQWVEIDAETEALFRQVIALSERVAGRFDISLMPLLRLWGFYSKTGRKCPDPEEIGAVLRRVNYREVEITPNRIRIGPQQEITTGGFLKGYALDCLMQAIHNKGITDVIVNAGGSSIACLNDKKHPCWRVVVADPADRRIAGEIRLRNECCSTAAISGRKVMLEGREYGHIFDPVTGYPVKNRQCGVVTGSCLSGDIFSTALLGCDRESFVPEVTRLSACGVSGGYQMAPDGELIITEGLVPYFRNVCV